jgi:hypothetical protein
MKCLACIALILLLACTTFQSTPSPTPPPIPTPLPKGLETPTPIAIELDQPFQLRVGQRGILGAGELTVELQTILRDWRCPSEVECSEAGAVDLALYAWLIGLEPTRFEPSTNPPLHQDVIPYDRYEIRLLAVDPYPETPEAPIPMEAYQATFVVSLKSE